ncbi:hypothetical protein LCGC14_0443440 [marine sediment metagenome]|uniref:DUF4015 domain-containing protein n=1 Tax=marine sediment metagenome TaxID=412755 RepID=A0A0F9VTS3_9ZZZZ
MPLKIPIWVHTVETAYPGSSTIPPDDTKNPFSAVYQKTNDGLRFEGRWDGHPRGIDDIADVVRTDREIYGAQGIGWIPWGVVHGRWEGSHSPAYAMQEGRLAGKIAVAAAGGGVESAVYIIDLEPHYFAPFPAFWREDLGAGVDDVAAFLEGFVQAGGEELWIAIDPRPQHLDRVSFRAWSRAMEGLTPAVTRILPMTYFTDFVAPRVAMNLDAEVVLSNAVETFGRFGVPPAKIFPILPAPATPSVMEFAIGTSHRLGCGGVSVYQRGNLSFDTANAIAALRDPWGAEEVEEPVPAFDAANVAGALQELSLTKSYLRVLTGDLRSLAESIDNELDDLKGVHKVLFAELLDARNKEEPN